MLQCATGLRSTMGKRSSISTISSMITGAVDPLASVLSLKTLGAMAPQKSLHAAYGKLSAIGLVQHPYFTLGCYAVASRGNTFAILQVCMCLILSVRNFILC